MAESAGACTRGLLGRALGGDVWRRRMDVWMDVWMLGGEDDKTKTKTKKKENKKEKRRLLRISASAERNGLLYHPLAIVFQVAVAEPTALVPTA